MIFDDGGKMKNVYCIDCGFCLPCIFYRLMPPEYNENSSCLHEKNAKTIVTPIQEYYEYPLCIDKNKKNDCKLFEQKIKPKQEPKVEKKKSFFKRLFKKLDK